MYLYLAGNNVAINFQILINYNKFAYNKFHNI